MSNQTGSQSGSQESRKHLKDVTSQASDFAKNIWLAGLGAYGRAFDEAQERYEQASKETPRLFNELVEKGAKLEGQARERLNEATARGKGVSIEERINRMRSSLGFGNSASVEDLDRVEKKVDALARKVDKLLKESGATTAAPKKPATRRATAK